MFTITFKSLSEGKASTIAAYSNFDANCTLTPVPTPPSTLQVGKSRKKSKSPPHSLVPKIFVGITKSNCYTSKSHFDHIKRHLPNDNDRNHGRVVVCLQECTKQILKNAPLANLIC